MFSKERILRWLIGMAILAALQCAGLAANQLAAVTPAQAQIADQPYQSPGRVKLARGFFQNFFGPYRPRRYAPEEESRPQHVDHSHAPSAPKTDKTATPTTTIVVMGDGMADWLGYGLEDAFSDTPGVAIVRKVKQRSGLLRYDVKDDLDWWHVARDELSREKTNYVVIMLGLNDRENIREKDLAREAEKQKAEKELANKSAAKGAKNQDQAGKAGQEQTKAGHSDQPSIVAPEPKRSANGVVEFRSERWAKIYSRRIDETIAALKSKGVPVFWVGLPSIRGTKSTADAVYLNDLFRTRAARAGIVYVDIWDGFVDDAGKYSTYGPDYEGQTRRLRTADGVYFTKYGARKLAHYVEREVRRYMSNRALSVSLPTGPLPLRGGKSAVRPTVGPVIPLTVTTGNSDQLLGDIGSRPVYGDATANDVLVKGEPVNPQPGRADNFFLNQDTHAGGTSKPSSTAPATGSGATVSVPARKTVIRQVEPTRTQMLEQAKAPNPAPHPVPKQESTSKKGAAKNGGKSAGAEESAQKTADDDGLQPPANVPAKPKHHPAPRRRSSFPFSNPLGWLR
jgi:uncharacterized protein